MACIEFQNLAHAYRPNPATVDDYALLTTMLFLWERLKLIVEPIGALGAAAALEGCVDVKGKRVGVILSGGNVDLVQAARWITGAS